MRSCLDSGSRGAGAKSAAARAATLLAATCLAAPLVALEYELAGVARDEPRAVDIQFEVCVRDSSWSIRCQHPAAPGVIFHTATLNAGELVRVMEFTTQHWATAVIESNSLPVGCEEPATSILWLLLASAGTWEKSGQGLLTPVYDPLAGTLLDQERRLKAKWELSDSIPKLPKSIQFMNDGFRRIWDSRSRTATTVPLHAPHQAGFTSAVARVSSFQTVGRLVVPRGFWFEQYGSSKGSNGAPHLIRRLTGEVQAARARCIVQDLVPRPRARVAVQDRRRDPLLATYSVSNGNWPNAKELARIMKRHQPSSGKGLIWQLALLCLFGVVPLISVRCWRRRERRGQRNIAIRRPPDKLHLTMDRDHTRNPRPD